MFKFLNDRQISVKKPPAVAQFSTPPNTMTIIRMTFRPVPEGGSYKAVCFPGTDCEITIADHERVKSDVFVLRPGTLLTTTNLWFYDTELIPVNSTAMRVHFLQELHLLKIWWRSKQPYNQVYLVRDKQVFFRFDCEIIHETTDGTESNTTMWVIQPGDYFTFIGDIENFVINTATLLEP